MSTTFQEIVTITLILQCLNGGHSIKEIAEEMKVSQQKVRGYLRKAGFRRIKHLNKWVNW